METARKEEIGGELREINNPEGDVYMCIGP